MLASSFTMHACGAAILVAAVANGPGVLRPRHCAFTGLHLRRNLIQRKQSLQDKICRILDLQLVCLIFERSGTAPRYR